MKSFDLQEELIEACKRGNRTAQSKLYHQYAKAMYNICLRMLKNDVDAEDVLQMSFVNVFKNLEKFKYDATPGAWIKRIVINNCINFLRKKKLVFADVENLQIADPDSYRESHEEEVAYNVAKVKRCMEQLSDGYRAVFSLYLLEGYDHKEIAQVLNITEATSKSQFHRAKQKMKILLKESLIR